MSAHMRQLAALSRKGLVERAGPFYRLGDTVDGELVGLVVFTTDADAAREHMARDPSVTSGVMRAEVLAWYP